METYIDLKETFFVMFAAIVTTSIAEFATWYFVYRTEEYRSIQQKLESGISRYNKQKEQFVKDSSQKNHDKKVNTIESGLKKLNQEMTFMKMKSNFAIALLAIITLSSLGNYYQGLVVAKLPFVPFSLMQNITHRGLFGTDYTDCSYIFLYVLVAFVARTNIQRIFGIIFFLNLIIEGFEGPKLPFQQFPGYQPPNQSLFSK